MTLKFTREYYDYDELVAAMRAADLLRLEYEVTKRIEPLPQPINGETVRDVWAVTYKTEGV